MLIASGVLLLLSIAIGVASLRLPEFADKMAQEADKAFWAEAGRHAGNLRNWHDFERHPTLKPLKAKVEAAEDFRRKAWDRSRIGRAIGRTLGAISLLLLALWLASKMTH